MSDWVKKHRLIAYFGLAYAISWAFQLPLAAQAQGLTRTQLPYWLHYLAAAGPVSSALVVTAAAEGRDGLRRLLGGLLNWRVSPRYYLFSVGVPAGLFVIAVGISFATTGRWPDLSLLGQAD